MKRVLGIACTLLILLLTVAILSRVPALADDVDGCMPDPTYTPDMPEYHSEQGGIYYGQGKYEQAIESYRKALELDPAFGNALHGLAYTYRAQGRLDLAIRYYGEVIRVQPDYAQPYKKRAEIYQFIGRYEDAEQDLNTFVEMYSQYPVSHITRGDFYMDRRDYAAAAGNYAAAIACNPDLLEANIKYAGALLLSGKTEEASEAYARAAALVSGAQTRALKDTPGTAAAEEIDTIVLTISPSFGLEEEMIDSVMTLTPDDALSALVYARDFFNMPEYIETGVADGDFVWITVNLKNGESKRVGGLEANEFGPEDFISIYEAIVAALKIIQ